MMVVLRYDAVLAMGCAMREIGHAGFQFEGNVGDDFAVSVRRRKLRVC
jgi:hypothetical protein